MGYVQGLVSIGMLMASLFCSTASDNAATSLISARPAALVREGSPLQLSCKVHGQENMQDYLQPSWMQLLPGSHDRYVVQNGHSYDDCCDVIDRNTSLGEVNLLIKRANKKDNGTWICFMPRITIAAKTQVFVIDSGEPLCSTSHNMDLGNIVIKGSRTSLSCIIRNNIIMQHSLLTWMKKGDNITSEWNNSLNYSYEASVEDNRASFSCLLQNNLLKTTLECNSSITIEVQFKPTIVTLISEHSNNSSDILVLRCETSSSYPAANIIWYHNGTPIDDRYVNGITRQPTVTLKGENNGFITQEELHITTTPGLSGYKIRCAAGNPVFNETEDLVFSDVILVIHNFPPKQPNACDTQLKSTSAYQDSTINTPMELTCTTCSSYPPTDIKLYIDRKLFNIKRRQTVNITSDLNGTVVASTAVLRVTDVLAGFHLSFPSCTEDLGVPYSPIAINYDESSKITIRQGENAKLACNINSSPRSFIQWYHPNGTAVTGGKYHIKEQRFGTIQMSTLHILKASSLDSGDFLCRAFNQAGNITLNFAVIVQGNDVIIIAAIIFISVLVATIMILILCVTVTTVKKTNGKTGNASEELEMKATDYSLNGDVQKCSKTKLDTMPRTGGKEKRSVNKNTCLIYKRVPTSERFRQQPPFFRNEAVSPFGIRHQEADSDIPHTSITEHDLLKDESVDRFDMSSQRSFSPYEIVDLEELLQCDQTKHENVVATKSLHKQFENISGGEADFSPYELLKEPIPSRAKGMTMSFKATENMRNDVDRQLDRKRDREKHVVKGQSDTTRINQRKGEGCDTNKWNRTSRVTRLNVEGLKYADLDVVRTKESHNKTRSMPVRLRSDMVQYALIDHEKTKLMSLNKLSNLK